MSSVSLIAASLMQKDPGLMYAVQARGTLVDLPAQLILVHLCVGLITIGIRMWNE